MTSQRQTTLFEDAQFNADELANQYDDECQWLVALSDWEITVILSSLRYAEWPSRWVLGSHTWDEIEAKISGLEYCLMAGCNVEALLEKLDVLSTNLGDITAAINGLELSVNCGGGCGGGTSGGSGGGGGILDVDPEDVTEETPPEGMIAITDITNLNKCHRINYLVDWVGAAIHDLNVLGVGTNVEMGTEFIVTALAFIATKNPVIAYIVWKAADYITNLAKIIKATVDIDHVDTVYNGGTTKDDLVCNLYSIDNYDVAGAVVGMTQILSAAGLTTPEIGFVIAVISYVGWTNIWYEETGLYSLSEEMNTYEGGYQCSDCWLTGIYDFTVSQEGWLLDTDNSQFNEVYETGQYFYAENVGVTDSNLIIYYPEVVSVQNVNVWVEGSGAQLTALYVQTADELLGTWTTVDYQEYIATSGITKVEFVGVDITSKYVRIFSREFNGWSTIQKVEFA